MILNNGIEVGPGYLGFWSDFTIAEHFGEDAIVDTYKRAISEWKNDYVYLTDLVLVLNHKIWDLYTTNERLAYIYNSLWEQADNYAYNNLKEEELKYYLRMTD